MLERQQKAGDILNPISENVQRILKERGLKKGAFAEKAGYTLQQFSRMMTGRAKIYWDDVLRLANALGVTPNELYGITRKELIHECNKDD